MLLKLWSFCTATTSKRAGGGGSRRAVQTRPRARSVPTRVEHLLHSAMCLIVRGERSPEEGEKLLQSVLARLPLCRHARA